MLLEAEDSTEMPTNEGIGIDLGIKDLAICSEVTCSNDHKKRKRLNV